MPSTPSERVKRLAVRGLKPRVPPRTWEALRDPVGEARLLLRPTPSLTALAQRYGTDKWQWHRYTPHYQRHLEHLRPERFTLLEIGIGGYSREKQGGASLRMWKDFFPRADIVGLDVQDKSFVDEDRIRSYRGSQTDTRVLDRIVARATSPLKVVVDDGSHRPEDIRQTFAHLFPLLADDGVYAIEDTQTSYWTTWGGSQDLHDPATTMALVKDLLDGLNFEEFPDDDYVPTYTDEHVVGVHAYHNLVFVEKGDNREGSTGRAKRKAVEAADPAHPAGPPARQRAGWSVPVDVPPAR